MFSREKHEFRNESSSIDFARMSSEGEVREEMSKGSEMDKVKVFLRVKPVTENESEIIEIEDNQTVTISCHKTTREGGFRPLVSKPAVRCTFEYVFSPKHDQAEVFSEVAMSSVHDVLMGKPALIFTYGITGSGKTYTMCGTPENAGILPRTVDVLFNSLPRNRKATKFMFKPDGMNGYDVLTTAEATAYQNGIRKDAGSLEPTPAKKRQRTEYRQWVQRERDFSEVPVDIPEHYRIALFVQYVEIYNDLAYDLLEEEPTSVQGRAKGPQARLVRPDATKSMYVFGATEVEVESADEVLELWIKGHNRKRIASTLMNAESSRSHTIFIIKVVQAPVDMEQELHRSKEFITVTQLNLVDLAGCEQQKKTGTGGDLLKEASSINQSLSVLRQCVAALRENQLNPNANKAVPYRDCKLTHLFKSYFEGRGGVKMVVCVNPRPEDSAQTLEVVKFAEKTQQIEIQPIKLQQVKPMPATAPPEHMVLPCPMVDSDPLDLPECLTADVDDEAAMMAILRLVEEGAKDMERLSKVRSEAMKQLKFNARYWSEEELTLKTKLVSSERDRKQLARVLQSRDERIHQLQRQTDALKGKLIEIEAKAECSERRAHKLAVQFRGAKDEQVRIKKDMELRFSREKEVLRAKTHRELSEQRVNALKEGAMLAKANIIREIVEKESAVLNGAPASSARGRVATKARVFKQRTQTFHTLETRQRATGELELGNAISQPDLSDLGSPEVKAEKEVATRRRSKSSDGRWLQHKASCPIEDDGLLQPHLPKKGRKSVTKLEFKHLESVDKYALVTGDGSHIQVVKGEVHPSPAGGSCVVFTEAETVRRRNLQEDPNAIIERNHEDKENILPSKDVSRRCALGIEGHPYLRNIVQHDNGKQTTEG